MSKIEIESHGRFSTALKQAIEEADLSLVELAQKIDGSYEHCRKLVAGRAHPSIHLLRILAHVLKADKNHWAELIEADKLYAKYDSLPKFLHQSPAMTKFEPVVPRLTPANQEALLQFAKTMLRQQKRG